MTTARPQPVILLCSPAPPRYSARSSSGTSATTGCAAPARSRRPPPPCGRSRRRVSRSRCWSASRNCRTYRTYAPDSEIGRTLLEQLSGDIGFPVVAALGAPPIVATSVRDVAARTYGNPADLDIDLRARTVVISSGVAYRRLGVASLEELVGLGVHYGAAMSASREMEGRDVYVVGGGNSAGQAAIHLARFARSVTIVARRPELAATMSDHLIREIGYNPVIRVAICSAVVAGGGAGQLEWIQLRELNTGRTSGWTGCRRRISRPRCRACSPPATSARGR